MHSTLRSLGGGQFSPFASSDSLPACPLRSNRYVSRTVYHRYRVAQRLDFNGQVYVGTDTNLNVFGICSSYPKGCKD